MKENNKEQEDEVLYAVVSKTTGEIVDEMKFGDYVVHQNESDLIIRDFNGNKNFVKLFDGVNELRIYLNNQGEFSTAMSLADFVCYDDCILRTGGHKNGKKLGIKDLADLMKIPEGTLKRNIMNLNKKGVINYSREGSKKDGYVGEQIVVNPSIYLRGKNVNATAVGLFERSEWGTS